MRRWRTGALGALGPRTLPVVASLSASLRACTQVCKPWEMLLRVAQTLNSGPAKKNLHGWSRPGKKHPEASRAQRKPSRRHSCLNDSVVIEDARRGTCGPSATKDGKTHPRRSQSRPQATSHHGPHRPGENDIAFSFSLLPLTPLHISPLPTAWSLAPCSLPSVPASGTGIAEGSGVRASLSIICHAGALAERVARRLP